MYRVARLSPDGRRIALDRGRRNERDLWVFDLERDTLSPLFLDPADDESPVWTPDGRQILFTSGRDGEANLHLRAADGTGPVERLDADLGGRAVRAHAVASGIGPGVIRA